MQKKEELTESISKNLVELSDEERLYVVNALQEYYIQYIEPIEKVEEYSPAIENAIKCNEKKIYKILKKIEKLEKGKEEIEEIVETEENKNEKLTLEQIVLIVLILGAFFSLSLGTIRDFIDEFGYGAPGSIIGGSAGIGAVLYGLLKLLENKKMKKIDKLYTDLDELEKNKSKLEDASGLIKQFTFHKSKVQNTINSL